MTATSVKEATPLFHGKDETEEKLKQLFETFLAESSCEGMVCIYKQFTCMAVIGGGCA